MALASSRDPSLALPESANIARHLALVAAQRPDQPALKVPRGRIGSEIDYLTLSFAELDAEVDAWSARLVEYNVSAGDRVLVMVGQGLPLIAAAFALFKIGAVPVVIDPGMGFRTFLACVERSRPRVLLGIPSARLISHIFRLPFRSVQTRIAVSGNPLARLGPLVLANEEKTKPKPTPLARAATDLAAVLFTSGSTGSPKGVCYEHGMFDAQVRLVRDLYQIEPGEIDLPLLPIFALFNPALGMTTIVPEIDPRQPATVDPAKIVQAILQEKVTNSFGSPTLWNKISDYCLNQNLTLPSLKRVLCAGAPVPASLWKKSRLLLPHGYLHSPYGATECLPVSSVSSDEVAEQPGIGTCVGRPVAGMNVRIIALTDDAIPTLAEARELPSGEIGEIIVHGPVVTRSYDALPEATRAAKIRSSQTNEAEVWHRMGDCGRLDPDGFLWFCGRKAERLETATGTLFTEPCEQVFRESLAVQRCALVGIGKKPTQRPALVVEISAHLPQSVHRSLAQELRARGRGHRCTEGITLFFFRSKFPVDVRHNAKIHRLKLTRWAARARGIEVL